MTTLSNSNFVGLDALTDPGALAHGVVSDVHNMYLEGALWKSRPGVVGLLDTPFENPIYSPFPYVKADGSEYVIFCSGPASSTNGGKLYQVISSGGVATEILLDGTTSFDFNAEAFRIAQGGNYAYFCAGTTLYRTDLTSSSASAVIQMQAPVFGPSASLSNVVLDAISSAAGWTGDTITTPSSYMTTSQALINATANGNVSDGTSLGGTAPDTWTAIGTTPSVEPAGSQNLPTVYGTVVSPDTTPTNCVKWFRLDDPGGGFQTGLLPVDTLDAPESYRNCTQFYFKMAWYTSDTTSTQTLKVTCNAYGTDGSTILAASSTQFVCTYSGQSPGQIKEQVFDFAGLGTSIGYVQVSVVGGDGNFNAASVSPAGFVYAAGFSITPVASSLTFSAAPTGGIVIGHMEPSAAYYGVIGGVYATRDYGSNKNWSGSPVVTFNLLSAPGAKFTVTQLVTNGLKMSLVLRQDGSTTEYIAPLSIAADGSYATVDLSAYISIDIYSAFRYLSIEFTSSLSVTQSTSVLFTISNITQAGNLPVTPLTGGISYYPISYYVEELDDMGDATVADPVESSFSPVSNPVQASAVFAVANVTIPSPVNANATHSAVFRSGGSYSDGQGRLIATVPYDSDYAAPILYNDLVIGSDTTQVSSSARSFLSGDVGEVLYILGGTGFNQGAFTISSVSAGVATLSSIAGLAASTAGIAQLGGDTLNRDLQNPYISWDHTTRTLVDNTPDNFLNLALVMQYGRDLPPTNCSVVKFHQNRVAVVDNQDVSISWNTIADAQNGIYFTAVDLSTDPNAAIKGVTYSVRPGDNDYITALISTGSSMLTLKHRSAAVLDGYDPSNFANQTYLTDAGIGCVAGLTAVACGNVAWFLGANGVYEFDGNVTNCKSNEIQPLLHPNGMDGGATIDPAVLAKAAGMFYDRRYHLFAPVAGGTINTVDYVYDFRNGSWAIWDISMTSGASLSGSSDGDGAYMGGYDGQLYTFAPGGDKATPGATSSAVPFSLTSRGMGQEMSQYNPSGESGLTLIEPAKVTRAYVMGKVPALTTLTISCYADDNDGVAYSHDYQVSGRFTMRTAAVNGVQGTQLFVKVEGFSLTQSVFRALGVEIAKRKVPN